MKYLDSSEQDPHLLAQSHRNYQLYLSSIEDKLPPGAKAFATAPWHYDFGDSRCPHDAWVESLRVWEHASGTRKEVRTTNIDVSLFGAYHDGVIRFEYRGVRRYSLAGQRSSGHGDWLIDEVRLSDSGLVVHEVEFATGALWKIECTDFVYAWIPGAIQ